MWRFVPKEDRFYKYANELVVIWKNVLAIQFR